MMRAVIAAAAWLSLANGAHAWTWLQAPVAEPDSLPLIDEEAAPQARPAGSGYGACIAAILQAQQRYDIPNNLLLAIGLQEAGWSGPQGLTIWPYSVNAAGEGRRFNSRFEAEAYVANKRAQGIKSIDIGCLQINQLWHPDAFRSLSHGFDPAINVDYAARFLRDLYDESGDWWLAAGRYHSRSDGPQAVYLSQLERNQQVANQRLPRFLALAQGADLGPLDDYAMLAAPPEPNYRTSGPIWGAHLAGDDGAQRTLYSNSDIEPVLPNFLSPET